MRKHFFFNFLVAEFRDFSVSPSRPIIYNTGLSTYNNDGKRMLLSEMVRVTGHELGHSWGSHHDPNTRECQNFIMNEFAQDGSNPNHMVCCYGNLACDGIVCVCRFSLTAVVAVSVECC